MESEKVDLKLNIQKTKILASGPITSWEIDGETVSDFIFGGYKVTTDGYCSHEIKRCLLLGRKAMTNLDGVLKSRDNTLPTEVHVIKAMVFPVCREPAYCILSAALSTASSFRIWNSSTGILSLPGARVRSSTHDKGHEEGGSAYAKARSILRSPPGNSRASTPNTRVCLLSALCFHLHLWLYGGLSPTTSLWKKS